MSSIQSALDEALAGAERVAILGCGSPLRGDDGAGTAIAAALTDAFPESPLPQGTDSNKTSAAIYEEPCPLPQGTDSKRTGRRTRAFIGDVAPENHTGEIKSFEPDLVLFLDALDLGLAPGEVQIIPQEEVGGVSFSTHILPLPITMEYLRRETGCRVVLLGIQAANLEFMAELTPAVAQAVEEITTKLQALF